MATQRAYRLKADRLWAELIKRRDGKCLICGALWPLEAHHLVGRRAVLRHDMDNGVTLCATCHKSSQVSPHQSPNGFRAWLKVHRADLYLWAQIYRHTPPAKVDYREKYEQLLAKEPLTRRSNEDE